MSNAAKHKKRAAEFELQKQFDKAVASYARAIEVADAEGEEVDVALLNKVGDLNLRLGRVADAVASYERAVEHYTAHALYNNAIALCNKILRHAPGRSGIYLSLGRICGRKGMRGDATRNLLEYARRMKEEGRTEEAMRSLAEVAALMPELEEVRQLVAEHAERVGISLPSVPTEAASAPASATDSGLVFLDIDFDEPLPPTPPIGVAAVVAAVTATAPAPRGSSLDDLLIFDPTADDEPPFETPAGGVALVPDAVAPVTGFEATSVPAPASADDERNGPAEAVSMEPATDEPVVDEPLAVEPLSDEPLSVEPLAVEPLSDERLIELVTPVAPADAVAPLPFLDEVMTPLAPADAVAPLPFLDEVMTPLAPADAVAPLPFLDEVATPVAPVNAVAPLPFLDDLATPSPSVAAVPPSREATHASTAPTERVRRLDPHDFILPGELPPIQFPERLLPGTAAATLAEAGDATRTESMSGVPEAAFETVGDDATPTLPAVIVSDIDADADALEPAEGAHASSDDASPVEQEFEGALERAFSGVYQAVEEEFLADELDGSRSPSATSAVFDLARERCRRLREEVDAHPGDWARRRRLAEALFEAGEREYGLEELAATALGLELEGALGDAARVVDELVRIVPDEVTYHQKRVELAVRLGDRDRLRESYLDLADALVRLGHAARAEPVYVRVLELDPWDDRARAALGDAAPPPPAATPPARRDEAGYVSLAEWLADDDAPRDTRMRMEAPEPSGDEDADFDRLLQHFREGVARSLGEDDYDSHYDLGVAYKEMGLLDDAIAEFQRALRSPTYRLPAYEALGQCFIEQGSFPVAVTVLSRALHEPGLDEVQRVGVLFLLGYACEALQRRAEAWSYYQRVYATDSSFRDVAERLAALDRGAR